VSIENVHRDAHATFFAMPERLNATNATKSTFTAMKGFLGTCHPEVTSSTVIFTKDYSTLNTEVPFKD
jgi:hypothetical protein